MLYIDIFFPSAVLEALNFFFIGLFRFIYLLFACDVGGMRKQLFSPKYCRIWLIDSASFEFVVNAKFYCGPWNIVCKIMQKHHL